MIVTKTVVLQACQSVHATHKKSAAICGHVVPPRVEGASCPALRQFVQHNTLAGLSYKNLVHVSNGFVQRLAKKTGTIIKSNDILIDAPPREREIEFNLQVCCRGQLNERKLHWRSLVEMSPVTQSLAQLQFDHLVKQVRIFGSDEAVSAIQHATGLEDILLEASNDTCS